MGHAQYTTLGHRDALIAQRRVGTFILVFSVVLVALVMTLAAVQQRDATCQDRAHEMLYSNILRPDLTRAEIETVLLEISASRHGQVSFDLPEGDDTLANTVDLLDTTEGVIQKNGFRLLRRTNGATCRFVLLTVFDRLCEAYPPLSMEMLPNVDYERATYHIRAVVISDTIHYVMESALITKDAARLRSFTQMQSLYPGFQRVSSSSALQSQASWKYKVESRGQMYYNRVPLDIDINIQQWSTAGDKTLFWRVILSTENILAEASLSSLEASVRAAFSNRNFTCTSGACQRGYDRYLV